MIERPRAMRPPLVQLGPIDRLVAVVAPERALRRAHARAQLTMLTGGYAGADRSRRGTQEWQPGAGSPDADLLPDLAALRDRSRDLERNAPLATGAIATNVTNVVGTGLLAQPQVDREALGLDDDAADRWERQAEAIWLEWSTGRDCDAGRVQTFAEQQRLAFRSALLNGDHFAVFRHLERGGLLALALQHIEADRVSNPQHKRDGGLLDSGNQVAGGVELDGNLAPLAFHVATRHPGSLVTAPLTWQRVPAYDESGRRRLVLHLFERRRAEQTRGVPYLAPVIVALKQLGRYTDAELSAAVISAMFTVFVKSEGGSSPLGSAASTPSTPPAQAKDFKLGEGAILDLGPGESIETANPGRPNAGFDPFVVAILRQIGVALELPFEVLTKHFTSSYSAARAALLEAWKFWRGRRAWLAAEFCQPVYAEVITEAVLRGLLPAPGFLDDPLRRRAWLGCDWVGPAQGQIDPEKEARAAVIMVEQLEAKTLSQATAELTGGDWERNHRQRTKEMRLRRADGTLPVTPAPAEPAPPVTDSEA